MLKGIPKIISPELLKVLSEMGHSDRIVIADGNFPSESMGKNAIVIRADGHGIPELLDAILTVFPLDTALNGMTAGTWEKHQTFDTLAEAETYLDKLLTPANA